MEDIDTDKITVFNGWLAYSTGEHNCVGGTPESNGLHLPQCGLEPIAQLDEIIDALRRVGKLRVRNSPQQVALPIFSDLESAVDKTFENEVKRC